MKLKKTSSTQQFESNGHLRTILLATLAKLQSPSTSTTGYTELRTLIPQFNTFQFTILINLLDTNELNKQGKKECLRVLGVFCELRGAEAVEYIPRFLQIINKRIQEADNQLAQVISDTIAAINEFSIQESSHKFDLINLTIDQLQSNFLHNNRTAQMISAQSLCRLIQTTQISVLETIAKTYTHRTLEILRSPHCRTQQGLLESLLSLILSVEEIFEPCLSETLATIQICFQSEEWNSRKVALDIVYTLTVIFPNFIHSDDQLVHLVGEMKFDKVKHVRDAAQIAMSQFKDNKLTSREHTSIFKQSANKNFFERNSDILIVENRPKSEELKNSRLKDTLVPNELHPKVLPVTPEKVQTDSLYQSYAMQRQVSAQKFSSPEVKPGRVNSIRSEQSIPHSNVRIAEQNNYLQNSMIEKLVQQRVGQVENNMRIELNQVNDRLDRIESLLLQLNKRKSEPISMKKLEQEQIMQKIDEAIDNNNLQEAYSAALTSLDDNIIIATMMKTGPCADKLDSTQVEFLMHKLRTLDWIEDALSHHFSRMPPILLKSIVTQLLQLPQSEQVTRIQRMLN